MKRTIITLDISPSQLKSILNQYQNPVLIDIFQNFQLQGSKLNGSNLQTY